MTDSRWLMSDEDAGCSFLIQHPLSRIPYLVSCIDFEQALKNDRAARLFKITNFSRITQYLKRPVETSRHLSILRAMRAFSWLLLMLIGVAPAAFAQTTHLQGRLLGYDGQPMELAHVYLIELSGRMPRVRFGDPTSQTARFAQLYEDKSKRRGAFDLDWYDDAVYARVRHEPELKAKKWALEHPEAARQDGLDAAYLPEPGLDRRPLVEARMALDAAIRQAEEAIERLRTPPGAHVKKIVIRSRPPFDGTVAPLAVGQPTPAFSVPSVDDPTRLITNRDLEGCIVLIDFWATWCGPCIGEMVFLHEAKERFSKAGFDILSISLDGLNESVRDFRAIKGRAMPWLHGIALDSAGDRVLVRFDVRTIPRAVLVDRDGTILRTDDLRGPDLLRTLEEVFGEPPQQED